MLIFGYGPRRPKDHGPLAPARCPACHNESMFHLVVQRNFVSFFFVPVIPAGAQRFVQCGTCGRSGPLDKAHGARADAMVRLTAAHQAGRVTDAEYDASVLDFWSRLGALAEPGAWGEGAWGEGTWGDPAASAGGWEGGWGAGPPRAPEPPSNWGGGQSGPGAGAPVPDDAATGGAPPPSPGSRRPDPQPGWYPDPFGIARERFWDGTRWTQGTNPPVL